MKKIYKQPQTLLIAANPSAILCSSGYMDPDMGFGGDKGGFGGG